LGGDLGRGALNIGDIAVDVIVAEAFDRAANIYQDADAIPRGGRMGKPDYPPELSEKARVRVVGGHAVDGRHIDRPAGVSSTGK
jgi:hypothetical protein